MATKDITDHAVCQACKKAHGERFKNGTSLEILQRESGEPVKVCIRAMMRAEQRGLIEYGVSVNTAWITDKGKSLVASTSEGE